MAELTEAQMETLVGIAASAIDDALAGRAPRLVDLDDLPPALRDRRGAFVTLRVAGALNGCIGSMAGEEALAHDVARLALEAAFDDPRLPPLRAQDLPGLEIEVSVLSPLEPVPCASRAELLAALRPGIDGLLIGAGRHRGVFLPDVWESLREPNAFVAHLLAKAGLPPRSWSAAIWAQRFTTRRCSRSWAE